jgi:hypothetical protein
MAKQTTSEQNRTPRITMPDVVDLSTYNRLDVVFTNGKDEIFNIQFRRETDGSAELAVNLIGPTGEVTAALTLFDLEV